MRLSANDLSNLCSIAELAARQAGTIIRNFLSQPVYQSVPVMSKAGGDSEASQVVTQVDLDCEKTMVEILSESIESFDIGLLTEECQDNGSRLSKDYFWCIDPLDGTLAFIEKKAGFAVSIALVSQAGEPVLGVVYDPQTDTLYSAFKNGGVFKNGLAWYFDDDQTLAQQSLTVVFDRGLVQKPLFEAMLSEIKQFARQQGFLDVHEIHDGGAVMNACWVLEQHPACYFKIPKPEVGGGSLWDFAATACLFNEMGAYARDFSGNPLALNPTMTTFMHERGVFYSSTEPLADLVRACVQRILSKS